MDDVVTPSREIVATVLFSLPDLSYQRVRPRDWIFSMLRCKGGVF